MDVVAIADDFCLDIFILHTGGDHTGIAVMDGRHGVVKMGQVGSTGLESHSSIFISSIGVGNGYSAKRFGFFNEFFRTGQLRSQVHNANQTLAAIVKRLEAFKIGIFR